MAELEAKAIGKKGDRQPLASSLEPVPVGRSPGWSGRAFWRKKEGTLRPVRRRDGWRRVP